MSAIDRLYPGDTVVGLSGDALVIATVVMLLAIVLCAPARRHAAWRHSVLRTALLLVLVSPAIAWAARQLPLPRLLNGALREEPTPAWPEPVALGAAQTAQTAEPGLAPEGLRPAPDMAAHPPLDVPAPAATRWRPLATGTVIVWLAGVAFGLLRLLHGHRHLRMLRRSLVPPTRADLPEVFDAVRAATGVRHLPPVKTSPMVAEPLTLGVLSPVVVLPVEALDDLSADSLRDVLIHECAHAVRRDPVMGWLQRWVAAWMWLHPLIHRLNRSLSRAREELCDNYVLRVSDRARYSSTLLALARRRPTSRPAAGVLCLLEPRWSLEQRVAGLLDGRRISMIRLNRTRSAVLTLALVLGAAVPALSHSFAPPAAPHDIDLRGIWDGGDWGVVTIGDGSGTYTDTYSQEPGTLHFAATGDHAFSGYWKESDRHGGTIEFEVTGDGRVIEGTYHTSRRAQFHPGSQGDFRWVKKARAKRELAADPAIRKEQEKVEALQGFLAEMLVKVEPQLGQEEVQVREILDRASEQISTLDLVPAELQRTLGITYFQLGELQQALVHLRAASAINPEDSRTHVALGDTLVSLGQQKEAAAHFEQAIELDPANPQHLLRLAQSYQRMGRLAEARMLLERALELAPADGEVLQSYGSLMLEVGDMDRAQVFLRRAHTMLRSKLGEEHPMTVRALTNLGVLLHKNGQQEESIKLLEEALWILGNDHPQTADVHRIFAQVLLEMGRVEESQAHAREAARRTEKDSDDN